MLTFLIYMTAGLLALTVGGIVAEWAEARPARRSANQARRVR